MKTLRNHTLIYDKDCPMCCIYTSAFMKAGVLDKNGREPYNQDLYPSNQSFDAHKAKNEIALVNTETGQVLYGIDSMFTVIGHAVPVLKPLFRFRPFKWLMKKAYSFISYNRKVIAPPAKNPNKVECTPDVNLKYRWLYITFAALIAGFISVIGLKITGHEAYFSDLSPEFAVITIIAFRLAIQGLVVSMFKHKDKVMDYLGNLATVNLQLAFLVGIGFIVNTFVSLGGLIIILGLVYANYIHFKRLKSINLNPWFLAAWNLQWAFIVLIISWLWN